MTMQQAFAAGDGRKATFEGNPSAISYLQLSRVSIQTRCPTLDVSSLLPICLWAVSVCASLSSQRIGGYGTLEIRNWTGPGD